MRHVQYFRIDSSSDLIALYACASLESRFTHLTSTNIYLPGLLFDLPVDLEVNILPPSGSIHIDIRSTSLAPLLPNSTTPTSLVLFFAFQTTLISL